MTVTLKSPNEIAAMREAGRLTAEAYEVLREQVQAGATTYDLDRLAEEFILSKGALPLYKGYVPDGGRGIPPFPGTICASVNEVICHGIPSKRQILKDGDIIGVDIGLKYRTWCGDMCVTYAIGQVDDRTQKLLDVAKHCLEVGIDQAKSGNRLGDIGEAIERYVSGQGFSIVREYTGHGVGHDLHEGPTILHVGKRGTGMKLRPGMVFTIEPMINMGKANTRLLGDHWTVVTADGSKSAQFEHTLAITENGTEILTKL